MNILVLSSEQKLFKTTLTVHLIYCVGTIVRFRMYKIHVVRYE